MWDPNRVGKIEEKYMFCKVVLKLTTRTLAKMMVWNSRACKHVVHVTQVCYLACSMGVVQVV